MSDQLAKGEFKITPTGDLLWKQDEHGTVFLCREGMVIYGISVVAPENPATEEPKYHTFVALANGGTLFHEFPTLRQAEQCLKFITDWRMKH